MFNPTLFLTVWGSVALFIGWWTLLVMAILYGGAILRGYVRATIRMNRYKAPRS